jgi:CRISPR-associated protein Cas1
VHSGTQHAFIYDIADLYKATLTIPLAFALHDTPNPERAARSRLRDDLRMIRLLPTIVTDIQNLLDLDREMPRGEDDDESVEMVHLWDPRAGNLRAGVNYGSADDDGPEPQDPIVAASQGDENVADNDDVIVNLGGPWPQ